MSSFLLVLSSYLVFDIGQCLEADYFVEEMVGYSNVFGSVPDPDKSTDYVRFVGVYDSVQSCITQCVSLGTDNNECESITYMKADYYVGGYQKHCYGRFGRQYGTVWTPVNDSNAIAARIIYPCTSDLDCSLNGVCAKQSGNCSCSPGWTGYHCAQLNFDVATKGNGYVYPYNISSWGGSVIIDQSDTNDDTKYHMFLSQFDNHCGVNAWVPNSKVVHARSTKGFNSKYEEIDVVHQHFSHEPDIVYGPNGELVIYFIAANTTHAECQCKDGSTPPNSCNGALLQFLQFMQYSENGDPAGPWSEPATIIFGGPTPTDDPNLAGVIASDGSFIGLGRSWDNGYSSVYLIQSDDWKNGGKYKIDTKQQLFPQLGGGGTEDPFVYVDCNGNYHAIWNNQSPNWQIPVCGGHSYSQDGVNWIYTGTAFGNNVQFDDGTNVTFSRRERPHFAFAQDGCTPIALTTATQYGGTYGDASYTLLQPLKK